VSGTPRRRSSSRTGRIAPSSGCRLAAATASARISSATGPTRCARSGGARCTSHAAATPNSLFLFANDDGSFRGWYVNIERGHERTALGFDYEDELLDVWVALGAEPELLDQDELDEAVARGFVTTQRADEIRAIAQYVLERPPWPTGWEGWRPKPGWQLPELPHGWEKLDR
jgi:Protein of unknown function (DUF402)